MDECANAERCLVLANEAQQRGKFGQSHRLYAAGLETVRQTELRATLLVNRAVLWARTKNWETSLRDAEEAKELRPTWAHAHQCYAAALEGLGRFEEAVQAFEEALEIDPCNPDIRRYIQEISDKMKKDGYVKETGSRSMHVQNRKLQRAAAPEFQQSAPPDVLLDAEAIMDPSHVFGQQSTEESSPPRVQNASPAFSASPTFKPSTVRYDRSIPNMSADRQHHVEVRQPPGATRLGIIPSGEAGKRLGALSSEENLDKSYFGLFTTSQTLEQYSRERFLVWEGIKEAGRLSPRNRRYMEGDQEVLYLGIGYIREDKSTASRLQGSQPTGQRELV